MKVILFSLLILVAANDTFNYEVTDENKRDFGPADWDQVECDNVDTCPGWPTNWEDVNPFIPYNGSANMCLDCSPLGGWTKTKCRSHEQSPIHLFHNITTKECIDRHLMRYYAGECKLEDMGFKILPHVLRVYQPQQPCPGRRNPSIDFSQGYPNLWMLSFTDISMPSQHKIDGKQYDAEVILSHTYSVPQNTERLIGNVAIMLEVGGSADKYDFLDLYIRQWRKEEQRVIELCFPGGLPNNSSNLNDFDDSGELDGNQGDAGSDRNKTHTFPLHDPRFTTDRSESEIISKPYFNRAWHPYDWYVRANTEYYFRYKGSKPEPPCLEGVHWRVLRNPVKVSAGQLDKLANLLKNRLNPETCQYDTAGKTEAGSSKLLYNRPLQTTTRRHKLVYCDCDNWESQSLFDQHYCQTRDGDGGAPSGTPSNAPSPVPSFGPSDAPSTLPTAGLSSASSSVPSGPPTLMHSSEPEPLEADEEPWPPASSSGTRHDAAALVALGLVCGFVLL